MPAETKDGETEVTMGVSATAYSYVARTTDDAEGGRATVTDAAVMAGVASAMTVTPPAVCRAAGSCGVRHVSEEVLVEFTATPPARAAAASRARRPKSPKMEPASAQGSPPTSTCAHARPRKPEPMSTRGVPPCSDPESGLDQSTSGWSSTTGARAGSAPPRAEETRRTLCAPARPSCTVQVSTCSRATAGTGSVALKVALAEALTMERMMAALLASTASASATCASLASRRFWGVASARSVQRAAKSPR
mmetsp:Transcript_10111/g.29875  ORF Transcript_10111/g.29875 Transcript_10111/m.29875 type:complete len:250 (-) Transcript_10111:644-1393(-)